jgi:hypothetical protein
MLTIMDISRTYVNALRQPEAEAWTSLLQDGLGQKKITVTGVEAEPLNGRGLVRYALELAACSDPVPLVGKRTNRVEASFYRTLAPELRRILPNCWLNHMGPDWSWLVLDDVPNDWPAARWRADDVERVVALLASFHGALWQQEERLTGYPWLDYLLGHRDSASPHRSALAAWRRWDGVPELHTALSLHAVHNAGRLAPTLIYAAAGVKILRQLGGWPGVITRQHLDMVAELLDDPLPMLQPLRELPVTLVHGNPGPAHWHTTVSGDRVLLDWANVKLAPPLWDLVVFLEQMAWLHARAGDDEHGLWGDVVEETIVDSYLLRMHIGLSQFDARAMRQALGAARCLYVILTWLPRFAEWFQDFVGSPLTWQAVSAMSDAELQRVGLPQMVGVRRYLTDLFPRFWHAAKSL